MEAQYQFSVYDASHEKIGQEDIKNRKEMYGDNLTDAQLDQLETICDKINAAQYTQFGTVPCNLIKVRMEEIF